MNREGTKETTAITYNEDQQYPDYFAFYESHADFPYPAIFCSLSSDNSSTVTPNNTIPFETKTSFPQFWIYEQALGQYFNWIHRKKSNFEDQPSLIKHEIYESNKKRPSVIQSVGRVLPLEEAGSSSLPQILDQNHMSSLQEQLTGKTLVYKDQNMSDPQQRDTEAYMRPDKSSNVSNFEAPEERKHRYYCRFCNKPYHWRSHWTAHERIHTGERPFKCEICGKAFTRSDGLQCHKHTHLRKKDSTNSLYENKEYEKKILPKEVIYNDCSDKPFGGVQLTDEGKDYFKKQLNNNVGLPAAKKDFHCHLCKKSFFSSNGLQHHLRRHSKGKGVEHLHQRS